jgi:transcriptional regulator with XRE-family HTH domain
MDLVLKLREIRRMRGLTQKDVARISGVGEKTISSFETGHRIDSLKLAQLKRMLSVYGLTEAEFFSGTIEKEIAPWELDETQMATVKLIDDLHALPQQAQKTLLAKFQIMVETLAENIPEAQAARDRRPSYVRENPEWHMLTSRN